MLLAIYPVHFKVNPLPMNSPPPSGAATGPSHILVVDDAAGMRDVLAIGLEREGYVVAVAGDANEALEQTRTTRFDLILLDMKLPGMSGMALLALLRKAHSALDVPIIVISGNGESGDVVSALQGGANDYITKPTDMAVVRARVKAQLALKQLKDINDRYLRIVSHDLKKPIMLMLDIARQVTTEFKPGAPMTEDMGSALGLLIQSGEFMQQIVSDLFDEHALRDGKLQLRRQPTDLGAVVRQALTRNAAYAKSKGIALDMQFDANLPIIQADDVRLMQVLENLIGNAIKFSAAGARVTVHTRNEVGYIRCDISDTGPGIPTEDMGRLFVEYAQLKNLPTGHEKSTGLGLAISKELITRHGGEIGAHNRPEGGATFWFRLPLAG